MSRLFLAAAVAMLCVSATATGSTAPRAEQPILHVDLARSAAGRNYELFRSTPGGRRTRLTRNGALEWAPRWSPDGRRMVFERRFSSGTSGWTTIWVANADGTGQRQIVGADTAADPVNRPQWSPDGRWIAFEVPRTFGSHGPTNGPTDIWLVRANGSGLRQLLDAKALNFVWSDGSGPQWDWSPDSRRIVYTTEGGSDATRLVIIDVASGAERELVEGEEPTWSRRGWIAFRRTDGLYLIRSRGSGLRRLVAAHGVRAPRWSYDGARLAYERSDTPTREGATIEVVAADGSGRRSIAPGSEYGRILWSRDGRQLLFHGRRGVTLASLAEGRTSRLHVGPEYDWRG